MTSTEIQTDGIARHGYLFKWEDFKPYEGNCPVCNAKTKREIINPVFEKKNLNFVKCDNCGVISSSHYINPTTLQDYYSVYFKLRGLEGYNIGHENYKAYEDYLFNILAAKREHKYSGLCINILDYGGGSGLISFDLAKRMLAANWCKNAHITVVDYEEDNLNLTDPRIEFSRIIPEKILWDREKYDLVIANDVIEHIFFVYPVLSGLIGSVAKGGILIIKTAWIQPIYSMLAKLGWRNLSLAYYPEHVHDYSANFFQNIFTLFNEKDFETIVSAPSFFSEKLFGKNFLSAFAARLIRAPWYLWRKYPFVGGWMLIARRKN